MPFLRKVEDEARAVDSKACTGTNTMCLCCRNGAEGHAALPLKPCR